MTVIEMARARARRRTLVRRAGIVALVMVTLAWASGAPLLHTLGRGLAIAGQAIATLRADASSPTIADRAQRLAAAESSIASIAAIPSDAAGPFPASEVRCLAQVLYHEAADRSDLAGAAIGRVLLNRAKADRTPTSLCRIAFRGLGRPLGCLFRKTCLAAGEAPRDLELWSRSVALAGRILHGKIAIPEPAMRATHFHLTGERPVWRPRVVRLGMVDDVTLLASIEAAEAAPLPTEATAAPSGLVTGSTAKAARQLTVTRLKAERKATAKAKTGSATRKMRQRSN